MDDENDEKSKRDWEKVHTHIPTVDEHVTRIGEERFNRSIKYSYVRILQALREALDDHNRPSGGFLISLKNSTIQYFLRGEMLYKDCDDMGILDNYDVRGYFMYMMEKKGYHVIYSRKNGVIYMFWGVEGRQEYVRKKRALIKSGGY